MGSWVLKFDGFLGSCEEEVYLMSEIGEIGAPDNSLINKLGSVDPTVGPRVSLPNTSSGGAPPLSHWIFIFRYVGGKGIHLFLRLGFGMAPICGIYIITMVSYTPLIWLPQTWNHPLPSSGTLLIGGAYLVG